MAPRQSRVPLTADPRSAPSGPENRLPLLDGLLLVGLCTLLAVAPGYLFITAILAAVLVARSWRGLLPLHGSVVLAASLATLAVVSATYVGRDAYANQAVAAFCAFAAVRACASDSLQRARSVLLSVACSALIASVLFITLARRVAWVGTELVEVTYEGVRLGFPVVAMASVNHLSYSVALGLACGLAWLLTAPRRPPARAMVALALGAVVCVWAILLTETRGSLISIAAAVTLGLAVKKGRAALQTMVLVLVVSAYFVTISGSLLLVASSSGVESLFSRDTGTLSGRSDIWSEAYRLALEGPVFGYGLGADPLLAQGYGAHNAFLAAWLAFGLAGSAVYLAWIVACYDYGRPPGNPKAVAGAVAASAVLGGALPMFLTGAFEWAAILWATMAACSALASMGRSPVGAVEAGAAAPRRLTPSVDRGGARP